MKNSARVPDSSSRSPSAHAARRHDELDDLFVERRTPADVRTSEQRAEARRPPLHGAQRCREEVALEGFVTAREEVREDLRRACRHRHGRGLGALGQLGLERIELRLQRDVLAVEAHRLGHHRVARQARDAVHRREQHVVVAELDGAEREGGGALEASDDAHDFDRPFFVRVGAGFLSCLAVASKAASIALGWASCSAW